MTGKTHILGGLTLGLITSKFILQHNYAVFYGMTILGSLLPDIDHQHSMISKYTFPLGAVVSQICKHRTITHSLLFALLAGFLPNLFIANSMFGIGLFVGVLSHLILDTLNPTGVPWLYPFSKTKLSLGGVRTGSLGEHAFAGLEVLAMYYILFPKDLLSLITL